jgi:ABC-2 type transport system permease protein
MRKLWAFLHRDLFNEMSYKLSFVLQLLGVLPAILLFYFLSVMIGGNKIESLGQYGGEYFPFVLLGIAIQNYQTFALISFSSMMREAQLSGTLEAILVAPVGTPTFLFGSAIYSFVFNSFRIVLYISLGVLLFDVRYDWSQLPAIVLVVLLTIGASASIGILSASFILLFKKGDPLNWAFNMVSWLLGGVYYPISVMPGWLQDVAQLIPITHSLEVMRQCLIHGASIGSQAPHVLALGLWTALGLPFSITVFMMAMTRARRLGTLGHY